MLSGPLKESHGNMMGRRILKTGIFDTFPIYKTEGGIRYTRITPTQFLEWVKAEFEASGNDYYGDYRVMDAEMIDTNDADESWSCLVYSDGTRKPFRAFGLVCSDSFS